MTSPEIAVVVCPDRYIQERFLAKDFVHTPTGRDPRARHSRRHTSKQAQMCQSCMFGHCACQSETCTCVCRENVAASQL
jgi:hypothetical protein